LSSPFAAYGIVGINGAAFATALSLLLFNISKMLFLYTKLNMHPFSIKTLYTLFTLVLVYVCVQWISFFVISESQIYAVINICLRSTVILLLFALLMRWLNLSDDINKFLNDLRSKFLR